LLLVVLLGGAWWWLDLSERAFQAARVISDMVLPLLFDGRVSAVIAQPDGSWKVRTNLRTVESGGTHVAIFFIDRVPVLRGFISFPLLWALLIVSHRPWWRRLAWGTLLLTGIVLLQVAAIAWLRLVVIQRAEPSFVMESVRPPGFQVSGEPVAGWEWVLSNYAYYVATLFTPLVTPVVIWAGLSRHAWLHLLEAVRGRSGALPPRC
jgi:hypothetical protein